MIKGPLASYGSVVKNTVLWFTPKVRLTNQMTTRTRKLHGKRGKTKSPDQLK